MAGRSVVSQHVYSVPDTATAADLSAWHDRDTPELCHAATTTSGDATASGDASAATGTSGANTRTTSSETEAKAEAVRAHRLNRDTSAEQRSSGSGSPRTHSQSLGWQVQ
jgi:hypothetical protein